MKSNKLSLSIFFLIFSFIYLPAMERSDSGDIDMIIESSNDFDDLGDSPERELFSIEQVGTNFTFISEKTNYNFIYDRFQEKYFLRKEYTGIDLDSNKMLLKQLLKLDLKKFCENLESFVLSAFSFHDFSSAQPGRSLFFFFTGLLSSLKDHEDFEISVVSEFDEDETSFSSFFVIRYKQTPIVKISIKGVDEGTFSDEDIRESFFRSDGSSGCSEIKIFYHKKQIKYEYYGDIPNDTSLVIRDINYSDLFFDLPQNFINKITEENYIKNLWSFYGFLVEDKINSEKDFHLFILGLLANTRNIKNLLSNTERGHGRPDIIFKTGELGSLVKYVIELKASRKEHRAKSLVSAGMKQAGEQRYDQTASRGPQQAKTINIIVLSICLENGNVFYDDDVVGSIDPTGLEILPFPPSD